jgi:probable phosphoglycerate mutase
MTVPAQHLDAPVAPIGLDGVTRVLALRHGQTAWNAEARMQGQLDIPLNDEGRKQAERAARALQGEGIEAIYSSDLSRASETAQLIARALGLAVRFDADLRERCFGIFQGQTWAEIEAHSPESCQRWRQRDLAFAPEGAETIPQFYARCTQAAQRIAQAHPGQTIALVAHGGVMDCLYRAASRLALDAPRSWSLENASINRLLHTPGGFTLVGWNDTLHLEAETHMDETA